MANRMGGLTEETVGGAPVNWRPILLLGLAANLDNLGVGISYGFRGVRVRWLPNLAIACISLLATAVSMILGHGAAQILPIRAARDVGAAILFFVGAWVGLEAWMGQQPAPVETQRLIKIPLGVAGVWIEVLRDPQKADTDSSGEIDLKEATALGFALSLNNLGTGLGAGLNHFPVLATALVTGLGSLLSIAGGAWLGRNALARRLGTGASYIAALMLIAIAVWEWHG